MTLNAYASRWNGNFAELARIEALNAPFAEKCQRPLPVSRDNESLDGLCYEQTQPPQERLDPTQGAEPQKPCKFFTPPNKGLIRHDDARGRLTEG
jgi:hypothetical protein